MNRSTQTSYEIAVPRDIEIKVKPQTTSWAAFLLLRLSQARVYLRKQGRTTLPALDVP